MTKMKLLGSVLLVIAVLFAQVGSVAAAPQTQDITGTVQSITTETDENGVTTVLVTLEDGQTFRLSVDTAVSLGLVTLDPTTGEPVVDETKVGTEVTVDPTTVIPDEEPGEEDVHPISALLGKFFDVDASVIDSFHTGDNEAEQVFGFGVIAQALWMATDSEGETSTTDLDLAGAILKAKQSGDYKDVAEMLGLDPDDTPTNWGQFKKALKDHKGSLGDAVSSEKGNGKNKEKGNHGKGQGKGHGKP